MPKELSLPDGIRLSADHGAYFRDEDTLAIADLHLGYEASLQAEHVSMPRFQISQILERLERLLKRFSPSRVIINGDLKHEFSRNMTQEWDEVESLLDALAGTEVTVVRGNHDNYLATILAKRGIEFAESATISDGTVTFRHGHKGHAKADGLMVYAHEHPVVRFRDEVGAHVQLPCFLYDRANRFLLMPAFSPLASGTNVIAQGSSYMNPALKGLDMSEARVLAIHKGIMDFGKIDGLREFQEANSPYEK